jgi:type IV secretory pathway VirJ component
VELALVAGVDLPWVSIDEDADGRGRLEASFAELAARSDPPRRHIAADVSDLPLVELAPTGPPGAALAVILSGDGGWASLDREVGGALAARGIPVIGLDSLQYFWTRRTPDESATALERILRYATAIWPGREFVLVGYSRGADVLPFMTSRLPADLRARVALVALLGPALTTEFEFHISDWLSADARPDALPTAPEVEKLRGLRVLCVYGRDEGESLCRNLDPALAMRDERPGDHHFDGDYDAIGARIARELAR